MFPDFNVLLSEISEIKANQNIILQHVKDIKSKLSGLNIAEDLGSDLLPNLPLNSVQELTELESTLLEKPASKDQLVSYYYISTLYCQVHIIFCLQFTIFKYTGGNTAKECINRCMEKLLTNYAGQFCSWTGAKQNFKIGDLKSLLVMRCK